MYGTIQKLHISEIPFIAEVDAIDTSLLILCTIYEILWRISKKTEPVLQDLKPDSILYSEMNVENSVLANGFRGTVQVRSRNEVFYDLLPTCKVETGLDKQVFKVAT